MSARTDQDLAAFRSFRAAARRAKPTKHHRPALWECMLGTVYARNPDGETRYFDYRWAEAIAFVGPHRDVRRWRQTHLRAGHGEPRPRQLVWYVLDENSCKATTPEVQSLHAVHLPPREGR